MRPITLKPPPPAMYNKCPSPVTTFEASQIATLDPTGSRTKLFSSSNPDAAKVGDILLVRTSSGDPFAGVCINIRRQGVDTAILLRGQLTRVGVEMWYKIYSPNVEGIEVVQRRKKRARRARLYYMRYTSRLFLLLLRAWIDRGAGNQSTILGAWRISYASIKGRKPRLARRTLGGGMQMRIRRRIISVGGTDKLLLHSHLQRLRHFYHTSI